jgi:hypothetical protein
VDGRRGGAAGSQFGDEMPTQRSQLLACQTRHFLAANSRFATAAVPKKANKATKTEAGMIVWFVGVLETVMFKSDAATRMTASHIIPMASVPHISGIRI